jgi:branched-subunit amino acid transport protein
MDQKIIFLTIIGMGIVTYIPRVLPVWLLSNRSLPDSVKTWLSYIPVAVLSAMLLPSLFLQDGQISFNWDNIYLWAAIPAGLVAWRKRSLFGTVIVGMSCVALFRLFIHP